MKLISWNVNGLRANHKKGGFDWLLDQDADVFFLQETKAEADQLSEDVLSPADYIAHFNSSKTRKGYSGVALFTKHEPDEIIDGLGVPELDTEGRLIGARFGDIVLLNCYFPNGGGGPERLDYKMRFYKAFLDFIDTQRKIGRSVIFCGDVNTAHTEIDLARPKDNEKNTGFLPMERAWIDEVIAHGYVDAFRSQNPDKKDMYTYWDMKTRARDRNVGWRIDYFFVSDDLVDNIKKTLIYSDIQGSDHCPIGLEIEV